MSKQKRSPSARPATRAPSAPTSAQKRLAAERAAAARARIEQGQRRRRWVVVGSAAGAIVLIAAVLVGVKLAVGGVSKEGTKTTLASPAVVKAVTSVPASAFNEVGAGTGVAKPTAITAPALTKDGKPEVLYVGAEYCPYCAAERWALAVTLSRFGRLNNLGQTSSSADDVYPSTPTLSFHGATYSSPYITFTGREINSNKIVDGRYATLDKLTDEQQAIYEKYDSTPYVKASGIPFIDFGGKYLISGVTYDPSVLHGKTHLQVATAISQPSSDIAHSVLATANYMSAAICSMTDQQPSAVCSSAGVRAAAALLGTPKSGARG